MRIAIAMTVAVLLAGCQTTTSQAPATQPPTAKALADSVTNAVDDMFTSEKTIKLEEQAYLDALRAKCRIPDMAACNELGEIHLGTRKPGRIRGATDPTKMPPPAPAAMSIRKTS